MSENTFKKASPLVSVVTPVYNGENYLAECIESVLAQSYRNWEYIIVNNCSTDRSLEIAQAYARKDARIRIHNNQKFVDIEQNHNIAFGLLSPESRYCKPAHADDLLFTECLEQMVQVAEAHPSIGLVGSYSLYGSKIKCDGLPYPSTFLPGKEVCRQTLLRKTYPFLSPSSLLISSDAIRRHQPFFKGSHLHADVEAWYEVLRDSDFGFVHQVLTYIRKHDESMTSSVALRLGMIISGNLSLLAKYGPIYLDSEEYKNTLEQRVEEYYRFLAGNVLRLRDSRFRRHHQTTLKELGYPLSATKLMKALFREAIYSLLHPRQTARNIIHRDLTPTRLQLDSSTSVEKTRF